MQELRVTVYVFPVVMRFTGNVIFRCNLSPLWRLVLCSFVFGFCCCWPNTWDFKMNTVKVLLRSDKHPKPHYPRQRRERWYTCWGTVLPALMERKREASKSLERGSRKKRPSNICWDQYEVWGGWWGGGRHAVVLLAVGAPLLLGPAEGKSPRKSSG